MHIIPFKGRNPSGAYNLNLLLKNDKTYIMDNHLAAAWCWMQHITPNDKCILVHIDRHNDLFPIYTDGIPLELKRNEFDFKKITIDKLLDIKYISRELQIQLFRWDNYIAILNDMYPNMINKYVFATHQIDKIESEAMNNKILINKTIPIYELNQEIDYYDICDTKENKVIINLDIDYFFTDKINNGYEKFQFLSDEYVIEVAERIKKIWNKIDVFTIALSPDFCYSSENYKLGWKNSERVAKLISDHLNIKWEL